MKTTTFFLITFMLVAVIPGFARQLAFCQATKQGLPKDTPGDSTPDQNAESAILTREVVPLVFLFQNTVSILEVPAGPTESQTTQVYAPIIRLVIYRGRQKVPP